MVETMTTTMTSGMTKNEGDKLPFMIGTWLNPHNFKLKNIKKGDANMSTKIATRALRKKLYMLTQDELIEQITKECKSEGLEIKKDSAGNMWSIRFQDKPIFVAHMDTVIGHDSRYRAPLLEKEGRLSRPGFVLGADDRAGVNMILNHKHKINFILTRDEEIGCIGAKALSKNPDFIKDLEIGSFFIELDRKGNSDIIGNIHGYCEKGVVELLQTVLPNYKDTWGVLTDIDAWDGLRQGVNLSVGYYGAHTQTEYLNIAEWEYVNSKIIELSELDGSEFRKIYEKPKRNYYDYAYGGYNTYPRYGGTYTGYDDYDLDYYRGKSSIKCDFCHCEEEVMYEYAGYTVCKFCAMGLDENEIKEIETKPKKKDKLTDEDLGRCSSCNCTIYPEDKYVSIPSWEVVFCEECYEEKVMTWEDEL